jgi:hypothetical protein
MQLNMRAKNAKRKERSSWTKLFSEQDCRLVATEMTSGGFGVNTASTTPLMELTALKAGWLSLVIAWLGQRWKMLTRLFISLRRLQVVKYRLLFVVQGCVIWRVISGAYWLFMGGTKTSKVLVPLLKIDLVFR